MAEKQIIVLPTMTLNWTEWYPWHVYLLDARTDSQALRVPNESGVYEVKYLDKEERLTIGKTSNLRRRIKQELVKEKASHSSGKRIRKEERVDRLVIRWAVTDRPSAVEEELHQLYKTRFGRLPKHTKRT